jgi:hypothetical protein
MDCLSGYRQEEADLFGPVVYCALSAVSLNPLSSQNLTADEKRQRILVREARLLAFDRISDSAFGCGRVKRSRVTLCKKNVTIMQEFRS